MRDPDPARLPQQPPHDGYDRVDPDRQTRQPEIRAGHGLRAIEEGAVTEQGSEQTAQAHGVRDIDGIFWHGSQCLSFWILRAWHL